MTQKPLSKFNSKLKENQLFPDSQKVPFGPKQLAWLREKYGAANFRNPESEAMFQGRQQFNNGRAA